MKLQTARWAAVVYGRTRAADSWWQAAPLGSSTAGWLAQFVYAAFAGGRGLDACPRFLVAQDTRHRIIGVACQAHELSGQMYSDGQRELSCFVGWVADRPAVAASSDLAGPALEELRQQYAHWAAPVYQEIMAPVWDLPHSPFRRPAVTVPAAAPWDQQDGRVEYDRSERVPHPAEGLWPARTWPALWAAALVTTGSFTCVVGWPYARSARRDGVTHLGVADAPERQEPLAPARIERAPAPKPSDAGEPVSDPVLSEPQPAPAEDSASMADSTLDSRRVAITRMLDRLRQAAVACLADIATRKAPFRPLAMSRRARIGAGAALALGVILIMVLVITSTWL